MSRRERGRFQCHVPHAYWCCGTKGETGLQRGPPVLLSMNGCTPMLVQAAAQLLQAEQRARELAEAHAARAAAEGALVKERARQTSIDASASQQALFCHTYDWRVLG